MKKDTEQKKDLKKIERIKKMREKLAKNMGASNYFFYLDSNINSKSTRGF
ncbi:MAG: hypothetical protein MR384_00745 [Lachnospiraceae bacterium]|nr:hypothetical protein [Lachnospiraceae bacterium]